MGRQMVRVWLALFIFGQYFALGVWFVALGPYMSKAVGFDGAIGLAYASQGLAAIISTMFVGTVADRYISPRKLLSLLMVMSGLTLILLSTIRSSEAVFLGVILVHFLAFVPTIPLSNAVCLDVLEEPDREFARIRVFGTLGWISGGVVIGAIPGALLTPLPMYVACGAMLALSALAYTLPTTPSPDRGHAVTFSGLLGIDALSTIRSRPFWAVAGVTALSSIPLAFYNAYCATFLQDIGVSVTIAGRAFGPTAIQALGQVSELSFLLALPFALRLFGIRGVLALGLAGWIVRSLCFSIAATHSGSALVSTLAITGIMLHGMCYDFMLIGAALFVDRCVREAMRARAQSFLTLVTMGIGVTVGSLMANAIYGSAIDENGAHDWSLLWLSVGGFSAATLAILAASFPMLTMDRENDRST